MTPSGRWCAWPAEETDRAADERDETWRCASWAAAWASDTDPDPFMAVENAARYARRTVRADDELSTERRQQEAIAAQLLLAEGPRDA